MRTKLAIIALSGFAVSAVCLGGAFALGGGIVGNADFDFGSFDLPRCDTADQPAATASSRTLAWQGNDDRAAVALPANIHYQAGVGDQLMVTGDPEILAHIRVHDGVVGLDCQGGHFHLGKFDRVDVTLPGRRNFRSFDLLGTGEMRIAGLSQPQTEISLSGAGDIEAEGTTDNLDVNVRGAGNLKLGGLAAKNADVNIAGSGKVEIAPQESLNVDIAGSGTIYLRSEPKKMETSIHGSGHIVHADGASQDVPPRDRHARLEDDAAIRAIVENALANGGEPDRDALETAKAKLKARIRARVAAELDNIDRP